MSEPATGRRLMVSTVDYHTAGEPFRIVSGGVPSLRGRTILEKRRYALDHLDEIRQLLVFEPRGHADMYGGFVTEPEDAGAQLGVVFFHNAGYSTACGHGTIALVTWAIDAAIVPAITVMTIRNPGMCRPKMMAHAPHRSNQRRAFSRQRWSSCSTRLVRRWCSNAGPPAAREPVEVARSRDHHGDDAEPGGQPAGQRVAVQPAHEGDVEIARHGKGNATLLHVEQGQAGDRRTRRERSR